MKQPAPHHPLPSTAPPGWWLTLLTAGTMLAFAANSLLARLALQTTAIDPATFTATRLITGALTLALILWWQRQRLDTSRTGWLSAGLLFIYAAGFSYAYRGLDTGTGVLLLFAAAQLLMMGYGLVRGERLPPHGACCWPWADWWCFCRQARPPRHHRRAPCSCRCRCSAP